jgi:hypothetical protein
MEASKKNKKQMKREEGLYLTSFLKREENIRELKDIPPFVFF